MYETDLEIIRNLEKEVGIKLTQAGVVVRDIHGYTLENNKVIALGLRNLNLSKIPYWVGKLKNLIILYLHNNRIVDLSPLRDLKNLTILSLLNNRIVDISPLKDLENMGCLFLSYNQIKDISPLKNMKKLEDLYLQNNQITDISALKELRYLAYVELGNNPIKTVPSWVGSEFRF